LLPRDAHLRDQQMTTIPPELSTSDRRLIHLDHVRDAGRNAVRRPPKRTDAEPDSR
jgi:hypothetical protein